MADTFIWINNREPRILLDAELPVQSSIMQSQNISQTQVNWGPCFFNVVGDNDNNLRVLQTIYSNGLDSYTVINRWCYGYRLDPENPTNITWIEVNHPDLQLCNILFGTAGERTDIQVKAKYTVDNIDYYPVGCAQVSQDELISSIR